MQSRLNVGICLAALAFSPLQSAPAAETVSAAALDEGAYMRLFPCYRTPQVRGNDKSLTESKAPDFIVAGVAQPPADWVGTEFDDSSWARWRIRGRTPESDYGFVGGLGPDVSRQCLRAKFRVEDPGQVQGAALTVVYRGGMIVYLNGREIARGSLAKDAKSGDPETLAEDYPPESFVKPGGAPIRAQFNDPQNFKALCETRIRRIEKIDLPAAALRKGVNVLAFESIRAPYFGKGLELESLNSRTVWATCGLVAFRLDAASGLKPREGRPAGIQVWNLDRNDRLAAEMYGDPLEPLGPIVLVGARNGFFSGQVAVTATEPIRGLAAVAGQFKGPGTIPAANVRVRYALLDGSSGSRAYADGLRDKPEAEYKVDAKAGGAAAQVLITVQIPKDAASGDYTGSLVISAHGLSPVAVPVKLGVADWTVPDPVSFRTFVSAYQSPASLSLEYEVPEWSEMHWKYMERSYQLLGQLGNKAVQIMVVERTQFGNDEGMIYWVKKEDGGYEYDFSVFDRYMDLVEKCCGRPDYVVFQVWHAGGWSDRGVNQESAVTMLDRKTGKHEHLQVPVFATEESRKFWAPVILALRDRLAKRGLEKSMCLGILSDSTAPKEVLSMFNDIVPDIGWHRGCHSMNPRMTPYYLFGKAGRVVLHEHCYGMTMADPTKPLPRIWELRGCPGTAYFRGDFDNQSLFRFRNWGESALWISKQGVGRFGLDYWDVLGKSDSLGAAMSKNRSTSKIGVFNRWPQSTCGQREPTVYRLTAPGPDGAVPTLRFEALREGLQESEALIVAAEDANVHADKIGSDLAGRIQALLVDRVNFCRTHGGPYGGNLTIHTGWQELNRRLYAAAAEAERKLGR